MTWSFCRVFDKMDFADPQGGLELILAVLDSEEATGGVELPPVVCGTEEAGEFFPFNCHLLPLLLPRRVFEAGSDVLAWSKSLICWCRKRDSNPRPRHYELGGRHFLEIAGHSRNAKSACCKHLSLYFNRPTLPAIANWWLRGGSVVP